MDVGVEQREALRLAGRAEPDREAVQIVVSDPLVNRSWKTISQSMYMVQDYQPDMEISISTQFSSEDSFAQHLRSLQEPS